MNRRELKAHMLYSLSITIRDEALNFAPPEADEMSIEAVEAVADQISDELFRRSVRLGYAQ